MSTDSLQLLALFAFGLVITGIVLLGVVRAREFTASKALVDAAASDRRDG